MKILEYIQTPKEIIKKSNLNYLLIEKNSIKEFNNIVVKLGNNENIKKNFSCTNGSRQYGFSSRYL